MPTFALSGQGAAVPDRSHLSPGGETPVPSAEILALPEPFLPVQLSSLPAPARVCFNAEHLFVKGRVSILWITFFFVYKLKVLPLSSLQTVLKGLLSMGINKSL